MPGETDLRYRVGEAGVRVRSTSMERDDELLEVRVHPVPGSWTARAADGGGVTVSACLEGAAVVTVLLACGAPGRVEGVMGAAGALAAHMARAAEANTSPFLTLDTGAPGLDRAWGWATARVRTSSGWGPAGPATTASDLFWTGVGAMAVGDRKAATAALNALDGTKGSADLGLGTPAPVAALATLLAARLALSFGDTGPSRESARSLRETLDEERSRCGPEEWAFWRLALESLADALRYAASQEDIRALRAVAAAEPGRKGGVRLPTLGTASEGDSGAVLLGALLRGGDPRVHIPDPAGGVATGGPGPWTALAAGAVDAAYAAWRLRMDAGLADAAEEGACRGTWDPVSDLLRAGAPGAGILVATLAHGVLGFVPDAPSGRMRLAPTFPSGLKAFRARSLVMGETRVDLDYVRDGSTHRFVLTPREARVPPMLALEPRLPCTAIRAARVDGAAADLDATALGERTQVRVQIPLDGVRTLEVDCGPV